MKIYATASYECQRELELEVPDNATIDEIKQLVANHNFYDLPLSPPELIFVIISDENDEELATID